MRGYFDELGGVERAVVVPGLADGLRELDAGGVDGLEDALEVDSARDFLDEHGREAELAELVVHAEEVDLADLDLAAFDVDFEGHAGDEADETA